MVDGIKTIASTKDMKTLAGNLVLNWNNLNILRGDKPASGTFERMVYDKAVQAYGGVDEAKREMDNRFLQGTRIMTMYVQGPGDLGSNLQQFQVILTDIITNMNKRDFFDDYFAYKPYVLELSSLSGRLGGFITGGVGEYVPAKTGYAAPSLEVLQRRNFDVPNRSFRVPGVEQNVFGVGAPVSGDQIMAFKGADEAAKTANAQTFVGALSKALAYKGAGKPQSKGCEDLLAAMDLVGHPDFTENVHFQNAKKYLDQGKRDLALDELEKLGGLYNTLYQYANNIVFVRIDSDALRVFTARGTLTFDLFGSTEDYETFLRDQADKPMGRAVIQGIVDFTYDLLKLRAKPETMGYNQDGNLESRGYGKSIEAWGHAISIAPGLKFLSSAGTHPVEVTVYGTFVMMKYSFDNVEIKPVAADNPNMVFDTQNADITSGGWVPALGIYGVSIRTPARLGDKSVVRMEEAGIGSQGATDAKDIAYNAFAYVTMSVNLPVKGSVDWSMLATPMYSGLRTSLDGYVAQFTGEVDVASISGNKLFGTAAKWFAGAPVRVTGQYDPEGLLSGVTLTPQVQFGIEPTKGLTLSAFGGYRFNVKGDTATPGPFGGVGIAVNIGEMTASSGSSEGRSFEKSIPIPTDEMVVAQTQINQAVAFFNASANIKDVSGSKGQQMAKDLYAFLGKVGLPMDDAASKQFMAARDLLKAGNLKDGLNALRAVEVDGEPFFNVGLAR